MTTKTDLSAITLTNSEITAVCAKGAHPDGLLGGLKLQAAELANQIGILTSSMPSGSNKTALTAIRAALL